MGVLRTCETLSLLTLVGFLELAYSSDGTSDRSADDVVAHLDALVFGWVCWKKSTDLEDTAEVTSVP